MALRIQLDRLHHAGDGSRRTWLVRLEAAAQGGEQAEELAEHHVEHGTVAIWKIHGAVQRQDIVGECRDVGAVSGCHHQPNAAETLAIDFAQQV